MIKIKKEKTDVFSRLASKSIGNFKKNKMNIIEQLNNNNSKSKNKKNISKKKINNIQNKKNDINLNIKEDTPSRPEKKTDKSLLKLTSTPKAKQKQLKRFSQISLEMTKTAESTQTLREKNSKTLNSSKIKKMNSKSKIISKKTKNLRKKMSQKKKKRDYEIQNNDKQSSIDKETLNLFKGIVKIKAKDKKVTEDNNDKKNNK